MKELIFNNMYKNFYKLNMVCLFFCFSNVALYGDDALFLKNVEVRVGNASLVLKSEDLVNQDWRIISGLLDVDKNYLNSKENKIYGMRSSYSGKSAHLVCRNLNKPNVEKVIANIKISVDGDVLYCLINQLNDYDDFDFTRIRAMYLKSARTGKFIQIKINPLYQHESVCIVLDTSGSMRGIKYKRAIVSLEKLLAVLPKPTEVSFFWFPSCSTPDLNCPDPKFLPFETSRREIIDMAKTISPSGNTPLGCTLNDAYNYLNKNAKMPPSRRRMVLLSDGKGTCGLDPTSVVKHWKNAINKGHKFLAIGLDVSQSDSLELKKITKSSGGTYISSNLESLTSDFPNSFQLRGSTDE